MSSELRKAIEDAERALWKAGEGSTEATAALAYVERLIKKVPLSPEARRSLGLDEAPPPPTGGGDLRPPEPPEPPDDEGGRRHLPFTPPQREAHQHLTKYGWERRHPDDPFIGHGTSLIGSPYSARYGTENNNFDSIGHEIAVQPDGRWTHFGHNHPNPARDEQGESFYKEGNTPSELGKHLRRFDKQYGQPKGRDTNFDEPSNPGPSYNPDNTYHLYGNPSEGKAASPGHYNQGYNLATQGKRRYPWPAGSVVQQAHAEGYKHGTIDRKKTE